MRRALTMIEVLVALGLLSALVLTLTSWIQTTARAGTLAEPVRWRVAAEAVLQLIHDDLKTGDFLTEQQRRRNRQPRVMVENGSLRIDTRASSSGGGAIPGGGGGPTVHHYALDAFTGELTRTNGPKLGRKTTRLLLGKVDAWLCAQDEQRTMLTVIITSDAGQSIQRSYLLPP